MTCRPRRPISRLLTFQSATSEAKQMDFGVFLPVSGRAATRSGLLHATQQAEQMGFTTVWAADRIVIPWKVETPYNYNWSGSFFVPPDAPFLEPLTTLAFLAGATERLRLGGKNARGDGGAGAGGLHGTAEGAEPQRGADRGGGERGTAA